MHKLKKNVLLHAVQVNDTSFMTGDFRVFSSGSNSLTSS